MPQLDGIRGLAVITVLIQHWGGSHLNLSGIPIGGLGVGIFFVLSGYLITGILLNQKVSAHDKKISIFKTFWIRRIIRIFPVFYLVVILGSLFGIEGVKEYWLWHLGYLSNFLVWNNENLAYATHFWTLAVEEQFYLVWPFVVVLVPNRLFPIVVTTLIAMSPVWRSFWSGGGFQTWALLPSQLDYLCLGGMLAWIQRNQTRISATTLAKLAISIGVTGFIVAALFGMFGNLKQTFMAFIFFGVIHQTSKGYAGLRGAVLSWSPLISLGRISYCVYIVHMMAPAFCNCMFYTGPIPGYRIFDLLRIPHSVFTNSIFQIAIWLIFTLSVSIVSWFVVERSFGRLKACFPYSR
jgi:peptidoglycan/LPS O-acetylase OafA/YrhL